MPITGWSIDETHIQAPGHIMFLTRQGEWDTVNLELLGSLLVEAVGEGSYLAVFAVASSSRGSLFCCLQSRLPIIAVLPSERRWWSLEYP